MKRSWFEYVHLGPLERSNKVHLSPLEHKQTYAPLFATQSQEEDLPSFHKVIVDVQKVIVDVQKHTAQSKLFHKLLARTMQGKKCHRTTFIRFFRASRAFFHQ